MSILTQITKFNQIDIIPNSLIVLDIDETIIKFDNINKKWWRNTFDKYYSLTQDYDNADNLSLDEWISYVNKHDCDLIFLTARNASLKDITHLHLNKVNLSVDGNKIYFNRNKGDELFSIANKDYSHIKNIIVVDDVEHNLTDIKDKFMDTCFNLHLYNMIA